MTSSDLLDDPHGVSEVTVVVWGPAHAVPDNLDLGGSLEALVSPGHLLGTGKPSAVSVVCHAA